jgi:hypothetical protein
MTNTYIVVNLVGLILGEFDTENEAHEFADGIKHFCYVEEKEEI